MPSLYEIDQRYLNAFKVDEETGEVTLDEDELEKIEQDFQEKFDNIACYIKDLTALNVAIKDEKKSLDDRIKSNTSKIESLKRYLTRSLELRDLNKYETAKNKVSFRSSKSVDVIDESKVPEEYIRVKTETSVDKKAVLDALKGGAEIAGCELKESKNIQIK